MFFWIQNIVGTQSSISKSVLHIKITPSHSFKPCRTECSVRHSECMEVRYDHDKQMHLSNSHDQSSIQDRAFKLNRRHSSKNKHLITQHSQSGKMRQYGHCPHNTNQMLSVNQTLLKNFQLYVLITWRDQTVRCRRQTRRLPNAPLCKDLPTENQPSISEISMSNRCTIGLNVVFSAQVVGCDCRFKGHDILLREQSVGFKLQVKCTDLFNNILPIFCALNCTKNERPTVTFTVTDLYGPWNPIPNLPMRLTKQNL
jgi:hypothetical protein